MSPLTTGAMKLFMEGGVACVEPFHSQYVLGYHKIHKTEVVDSSLRLFAKLLLLGMAPIRSCLFAFAS
jgi:hypothetical protein